MTVVDARVDLTTTLRYPRGIRFQCWQELYPGRMTVDNVHVN